MSLGKRGCNFKGVIFKIILWTDDSSVSCKIVVRRMHYSDAIIGATASQITSLTIVYATVYSGANQRKHQSSPPLASVRYWPFVRGIRRWPVNSLHKWPVTRKMFPFVDVIMWQKSIDDKSTLIDSRNGLLMPRTWPSPETVLTKISDAIWLHWSTIS